MLKPSVREAIILAILATGSVGLWLGLAENRVGSDDANRERGGSPADLGQAPFVHVELLAARAAGFDPRSRDPFIYGREVSIAAAGFVDRAVAVVEERVPTAVERRSEALPANRTREPVPPKPTFTYIGYLGPKHDRIAVFTRGHEILLARVGELIVDGFRLREFRYKEVTLGYTQGPYRGETTRLAMQPS